MPAPFANALRAIILIASCAVSMGASGQIYDKNGKLIEPNKIDLFGDIPTTRAKPQTSGSWEKYRPLTFMGYRCKSDCSGHRAGYAWAERNDIDDVDDCTGRSQSFIEGCMAYVEENE